MTKSNNLLSVCLECFIDAVSKLITKENQAVLVDLENGKHHIITKYDIISAI